MVGRHGDEVYDLGVHANPEEVVQSVDGAVGKGSEVLKPDQGVRVVEHSTLCHLKQKVYDNIVPCFCSRFLAPITFTCIVSHCKSTFYEFMARNL